MASQRSGTERLKGQISCGSEQIRQDAAFYDLPAQHDFYCWSRVRRSSKLLDQLNGLNWEGDGIFSSLERVSRPPVQCKRVARSPVCRKGLLREMHPPAISPCHQMPAPHSLCKVVLQSFGVNRGGQLERSKLHPLVLPQLLFRSCLISTVVTGRGAGKVCSGSCTPLCHLMPAPQSLCKLLLLQFSHKLELPPFTRPATAWRQTTLHLVRGWQLGREKERD